MKTITGSRVLFALVCCFSLSGARALPVVLDDGGVHAFNYAASNVLLSKSTTVNVSAGASTSPGTGTYLGDAGIRMEGNASLNMTGGAIQGGPGVASPDYIGAGSAVFSMGSTVDISGGTLTGGANYRAGHGLYAINSDTTISGGAFTGGTAPAYWGGHGAWISGGTASISGGIFSGSDRLGRGLFLEEAAVVDITGGTFVGEYTSESIRAEENSLVSLSGGSFSNGISTWEFNFQSSSLEVWGSDLLFTPTSSGRGTISGTLLDGSSIDTYITLGGYDASLSLNGVTVFETGPAPEDPGPIPLPGAVWLLSSGLLVLTGVARRRR